MENMDSKKNHVLKNILKIEKLVAKHKDKFFIITLLKVLKSIAQIFSIYLLTNFVANLKAGNIKESNYIIFGYLAFKLSVLIIESVLKILEKKYYCGIAYTLRKAFYEQVSEISPSKLNSYINGDIITRFTDDLNAIINFSAYKKIDIISNILTLILVVYYIATFNLRFVAIAVFLFTIMYYCMKHFGKRLEEETQLLQEENSKLNTSMGDVFQHGFEIKSFEAEEYITSKNLKAIENTEQQDLRVYLYERLIWLTEILFHEAFDTGYFVIGAMLAYLGRGDLTLVVGLLLITGYTANLLFQVPYLYSSIYEVSPKIERLMDFIEGKEMTEQSKLPSIPKTNLFDEGIKINDLSYQYVDGTPILKGIDLSVDKGQKIAIIGKSGSGKSTLLRLLTAYDTNYTGEISLCGKELKDYSIEEIRKNIAYYPQESFLFNKSIMENFLLFSELKEEDLKAKIKKYESIVSIKQDVSQFPKGYDTVIDIQTENISKGQLQRLCLMICLIKESPFLLIDEGFSALDPKTTESVVSDILANNPNTVITVMHQMSAEMMKQFDSIIIMDEGRIVAMDSHGELMKTKEYESLLAN